MRLTVSLLGHTVKRSLSTFSGVRALSTSADGYELSVRCEYSWRGFHDSREDFPELPGQETKQKWMSFRDVSFAFSNGDEQMVFVMPESVLYYMDNIGHVDIPGSWIPPREFQIRAHSVCLPIVIKPEHDSCHGDEHYPEEHFCGYVRKHAEGGFYDYFHKESNILTGEVEFGEPDAKSIELIKFAYACVFGGELEASSPYSLADAVFTHRDLPKEDTSWMGEPR